MITLVAAPGDGEVTVVPDETMGEQDPLLAKLLVAATTGLAPAQAPTALTYRRPRASPPTTSPDARGCAGTATSVDLASVFASKENQPGLSAALDAGRAGFLRRLNEGGISLVAYEPSWPPDTAAPDIRVQSMFGSSVQLPGIDGLAGPRESTLAELNETLPDE